MIFDPVRVERMTGAVTMQKMILVTGAAGFIGSHLAETLLSMGYNVLGVDDFNPYYDPDQKRNNIESFKGNKNFSFIEGDLLKLDFEKRLKDVSAVFHLAAQAGVRNSWGGFFTNYAERNILVTQKLLEFFKDKKIEKFIYASSSSIYGDAIKMPTSETIIPSPVSPYGVTKLAGEHLVSLYRKSYGLPGISLRFFTVYGPRQRPDMGFHRFIRAGLKKEEIKIYGDGSQTRDFTYVSDIVQANIQAFKSNISKMVFNIGGGQRVSLNHVLDIIERNLGILLRKKYIEAAKGDVKHTSADITSAQRHLNYNPSTPLEDGIRNQINWMKRI